MAGRLSFGGPPSPALAGLRSQLSRETSICWLLVSLTCLVLVPVSWFLGSLIQVVPLAFSEAFGNALPSASHSNFGALSILTVTWGSFVGISGMLVLPIAAIVAAMAVNRRTYTLTARDLVWGGAGLCLVDESFSRIVEEAAHQRYRPNLNPVRPGNSFADRLNHFAYHYRQYLRLSHGPRELTIPLVVQGNCWVEGVGLGLASCVPCIGSLFVIPLALRAILVWPRIVAIKQAAVDFLAGKFDADLERAASLPPR